MAFAGQKIAEAFILVRADSSSQLPRDLDKTKRRASKSLNKIGASFGAAGGVISLVGSALASYVKVLSKDAIPQALEAIETEARLAAALKATGGAAGFTQNELFEFASELQKTTRQTDDSIMELMSRLVAFKSVSGDVFKRATEAAIDMSAAGFGTLEGNAKRLGKALERPDKGLRSLRRAAVIFTKEQEKQIKTLMEQNRLFEAQKIILDAVESKFKGVEKELALTDPGRLEQLDNRMNDLREELGKGLLPLLVRFRELQIKAFDNQFIRDLIDAIRIMTQSWKKAWEGMTTFSLLQIAKLRVSLLEMAKDSTKELSPTSKGFTKGVLAALGIGSAVNVTGNQDIKNQRDRLQEQFDKLKLELKELDTQVGTPELPSPERGKRLSGRAGIPEFGRMFQDALLKEQDKQTQMIKALEKNNKIDEKIFQEIKKQNNNAGMALT